MCIRDRIKDGTEAIEYLSERIAGRYAQEEVRHPETGEVLVEAGAMITDTIAEKIEEVGIEKVAIRSVLNCKSRYGVCRKCYGRNLATGRIVEIGEAVGIVAAQSIGEPGTQLTMRTFHTGGVAGDDITQGLPRVEELFEARKPKGQAIITESDGIVSLQEKNGRKEIVVTQGEESYIYQIPFGSRIKVKDGQQVEAGEELTEGSINPHDLLSLIHIYVLEDVIQDHPVLLNRAPTLHRLGIQAFEPVLVEGRALQIHPLVCTTYNADFDGDQMAVHVPLSAEAQVEARVLMLSSHNILNPKDGRPVVTPTQDMVLGAYYLTLDRPKEDGAELQVFANYEEAKYAYDMGKVELHEPIKVRYNGEIIETTTGRLIFNQVIPEKVGYYNEVIGKKQLGLSLIHI